MAIVMFERFFKVFANLKKIHYQEITRDIDGHLMMEFIPNNSLAIIEMYVIDKNWFEIP